MASHQAQAALELLEDPAFDFGGGANALILSLRRVPGVFEQAFQRTLLSAPRDPACPACGLSELDAARAEDVLRRIHEEKPSENTGAVRAFMSG